MRRTKLFNDKFDYFWLVGDWVCYNVVDAKALEVAGKKSRYYADKERNKIYDEGDINCGPYFRLYSMRMDGSGRCRVCDEVFNYPDIHIDGDWIVYKTGSEKKQYKVKPDGTGHIIVQE